MSIADLRHRLSLERRVAQNSTQDDVAPVWTAVAVVWADVRPVAGAETVVADRLQSRVTHEVRLRRRDGLGPDLRFRSGARVFHIVSVVDEGERSRMMICRVEERTP